MIKTKKNMLSSGIVDLVFSVLYGILAIVMLGMGIAMWSQIDESYGITAVLAVLFFSIAGCSLFGFVLSIVSTVLCLKRATQKIAARIRKLQSANSRGGSAQLCRVCGVCDRSNRLCVSRERSNRYCDCNDCDILCDRRNSCNVRRIETQSLVRSQKARSMRRARSNGHG